MTAAEMVEARDKAYAEWMETGRLENYNFARTGRTSKFLHLKERAAYDEYQRLSKACREVELQG